MADDFSILVAANDNEPGEWTLPALQRAAHGKLMAAVEDNERAARTLGRIYKIFRGDYIAPEQSLPKAPKRVSNKEKLEPDYATTPSLWPRDSRLRDMIEFAREDDPDRDEKDRAKIASIDMKVVKRDWRDPHTGQVSEIYVGLYRKGKKWLEYGDFWGDVRKSEAEPKFRNARVTASRMDLADMDNIDRGIFTAMLGSDHLDTVERFMRSETMGDIGTAAGFCGKQAEAVGKDRIRTMVRRAQEVFASIEKARKADYPWQVDPAVAMHFPKDRRLAA